MAWLLVITKLDDRIPEPGIHGEVDPADSYDVAWGSLGTTQVNHGLGGRRRSRRGGGVGVGVGSGVLVEVGDDVGLGVAVGVLLGACVAGGVGVGDGLAIGSRATVGAGVCVDVGVSAGSLDRNRKRPSGRLGRRSRSGSGRGCRTPAVVATAGDVCSPLQTAKAIRP